MSIYQLGKKVVKSATQNPLITAIKKNEYEKKFRFNQHLNLFKGVFDSFKSAEDSIHYDAPNSYDNSDSANMYKEIIALNPGDYPNLFWLEKLLAQGYRTLFDFGGHIGVKYYTYRPHLNLPQDFLWTTYDLPKVIDEGIRYAQSRDDITHLKFTKEPQDAAKSEIFCAFGSLQYIDVDIAEFINSLISKPKMIIITIPTTTERTYYTVNSIGTAFCPYIIRNEKQFIESLYNIGYSLKQNWNIAEKKIEIPYHDAKYSLDHYRGFIFEQN